jgi:hypothetical protein
MTEITTRSKHPSSNPFPCGAKRPRLRAARVPDIPVSGSWVCCAVAWVLRRCARMPHARTCLYVCMCVLCCVCTYMCGWPSNALRSDQPRTSLCAAAHDRHVTACKTAPCDVEYDPLCAKTCLHDRGIPILVPRPARPLQARPTRKESLLTIAPPLKPSTTPGARARVCTTPSRRADTSNSGTRTLAHMPMPMPIAS